MCAFIMVTYYFVIICRYNVVTINWPQFIEHNSLYEWQHFITIYIDSFFQARLAYTAELKMHFFLLNFSQIIDHKYLILQFHWIFDHFFPHLVSLWSFISLMGVHNTVNIETLYQCTTRPHYLGCCCISSFWFTIFDISFYLFYFFVFHH